jgi:hypothetical protein
MTETSITNQSHLEASQQVKGVLSAWLSSGKSWWGVSLTIQIITSLGGAVAVLVGSVSPGWALLLGLTSVAALLGRWRGDFFRQLGEALLRHVELEDGMGWPISRKVLADSLARGIGVARSADSRAREQENFYASTRKHGPLRTLDNVSESAWWTQQNAHWIAWKMVLLVVVLCLMAVWSLLVAAAIIGPPDPIEVSRLITAGISIVFAGNLVRLPYEYFRLSSKASESDQKASELIGGKSSPTEAEAVRLLGDYQLARAMGPPIPDWVWRRRRDRLNEIWNKTRIAS